LLGPAINGALATAPIALSAKPSKIALHGKKRRQDLHASAISLGPREIGAVCKIALPDYCARYCVG